MVTNSHSTKEEENSQEILKWSEDGYKTHLNPQPSSKAACARGLDGKESDTFWRIYEITSTLALARKKQDLGKGAPGLSLLLPVK
jgi:hypothetical protein